MRNPSPTECAYAAGFFDGEGHIRVAPVTPKRGVSPLCCLRIGVTQDDWSPLAWMHAIWGGALRSRQPRANGRVAHDLHLSARQAAKMLQDMLPYLHVKKAQAEIAIEFQSRKEWGKSRLLTDEQIAFNEDCRARIVREKDRIVAAKPKHPQFVAEAVNGSAATSPPKTH